MTKQECMKLIRERIEKYDNEDICKHFLDERNYYAGNLSYWYSGIKKGLLEALEIVGSMVDNEQNKTK